MKEKKGIQGVIFEIIFRVIWDRNYFINILIEKESVFLFDSEYYIKIINDLLQVENVKKCKINEQSSVILESECKDIIKNLRDKLQNGKHNKGSCNCYLQFEKLTKQRNLFNIYMTLIDLHCKINDGKSNPGKRTQAILKILNKIEENINIEGTTGLSSDSVKNLFKKNKSYDKKASDIQIKKYKFIIIVVIYNLYNTNNKGKYYDTVRELYNNKYSYLCNKQMEEFYSSIKKLEQQISEEIDKDNIQQYTNFDSPQIHKEAKNYFENNFKLYTVLLKEQIKDFAAFECAMITKAIKYYTHYCKMTNREELKEEFFEVMIYVIFSDKAVVNISNTKICNENIC